jgi:N-acyl-L-homoserine lactone synthetase
MKVIVRTRAALLQDSELAMGMHRLRGRVFKDRLDWDVSVCNGLEIDQYDTFKPTYLMALEQNDVVGCVRLLPTTGRNMLADTFPVLLDGNAAPRAARIWESSRFCVDTKSAAATVEEWSAQSDVPAVCSHDRMGAAAQSSGHRNGY